MRLLCIAPCLLWILALSAPAFASGDDHSVDLSDSGTALESETKAPEKTEKPDGGESEGGKGGTERERTDGDTGDKPDRNGNGGGGKTTMPHE